MGHYFGDMVDQLLGDLNVCPLIKDVGETISTFFRGGFGNFVENIIEPTVNLALTALGAFYTAHCLNWLLYAPMTVEEVIGSDDESTAEAAATTSKEAAENAGNLLNEATSSRSTNKSVSEVPSTSRRIRRKTSAKTKALIAALIEEHFNDEDHRGFDKVDTDNEDDDWDNWCYKHEDVAVVEGQSLPKLNEVPESDA